MQTFDKIFIYFIWGREGVVKSVLTRSSKNEKILKKMPEKVLHVKLLIEHTAPPYGKTL